TSAAAAPTRATTHHLCRLPFCGAIACPPRVGQYRSVPPRRGHRYDDPTAWESTGPRMGTSLPGRIGIVAAKRNYRREGGGGGIVALERTYPDSGSGRCPSRRGSRHART